MSTKLSDKKRRKHEDSDSDDEKNVQGKKESRKRREKYSDESSEDSYRKEKRRRHKEKKEKKKKKKRATGDDVDSDESEKRRKKKLLKEAKRFLKREKMERVSSDFKVNPISEDDYFLKNQELSTWLTEERGLFFSNLSSEESRKLFSEFVQLWNGKKLSEKYYKGIEKADRTGHNWGFRPQVQSSHGLLDEEIQIADRRLMEKQERKKERKNQELLLDEVLPKATGREALFEKKLSQKQAAKAREFSPEPMAEKDIMGGGDDFQARLARERAWREKKTAAKSSKLMEKRSAFEEKESATMDQFRSLLNMAGGKITIPKRN